MRKFALFFAGLLSAGSAQAAAINIGQWYSFRFGAEGSALTSGGAFLGVNPVSIAAPEGPWTFSLASGGILTVVDGYDSGDVFEMFNAGSSLGSTVSASLDSVDCDNDITACLNNPSISKGFFALGAGDQSITGIATASPFGGGSAFFMVAGVSGALPEPASWAMLVAGFALAGVAMRRRRMAVSFA